MCLLQELTNRHHEFMLAFNAECDSLNPRPGMLTYTRIFWTRRGNFYTPTKIDLGI
jgi:hypothetical protein